MDITFHYYTVFFLCLRAGFDHSDSQTIAVSSQLVDNNILVYNIKTKEGVYETQPTQNYGFRDPWYTRNVFLPFHFFPGDKSLAASKRTDGSPPPRVCTANSGKLKVLLIESLKSGNLYRIGIALHTFADSYAHQNFSGIEDEANAVGPVSLVPPVGHAQVLQEPDQYSTVWTDPRLKDPRINNKDRFLAAAGKIYRYLCINTNKSFDDEALVLDELTTIFEDSPFEKKRQEVILDFQIFADIPKYENAFWLKKACSIDVPMEDETLFKGYNKLLWLRDEFIYKNKINSRKTREAKPGYFDSDFYNWHEASKTHRTRALSLIDSM